MKSKSLLLISGIIVSQVILSSFLMESDAITAVVRGSLPAVINEAFGINFEYTDSSVSQFYGQ